MKRQLIQFSVCLIVAACADSSQSIRPITSTDDAAPQLSASEPYVQGKSELAAGRYGLAASHFMTAYRHNLYDVAVLNALGITYDLLGRHDLADMFLHRALALDPSSPITLNNLGRSRMNAGDWQMAVAYLQKAQRHDGPDRTISSNLNAAKERTQLGRQRQAASDQNSPLWIERESPSVQILRTNPIVNLAKQPGANFHVNGIEEEPPRTSDSRTSFRADASSATEHMPPQDEAGSVLITIVNGTGRRGMASRLRELLVARGFESGSLANADHYHYRATAIFYSGGGENEARRMASAMPIPVALVSIRDQSPIIRIRIGADLLDYDAHILAMRQMTGREM